MMQAHNYYIWLIGFSKMSWTLNKGGVSISRTGKLLFIRTNQLPAFNSGSYKLFHLFPSLHNVPKSNSSTNPENEIKIIIKLWFNANFLHFVLNYVTAWALPLWRHCRYYLIYLWIRRWKKNVGSINPTTDGDCMTQREVDAKSLVENTTLSAEKG